MGRLLRDWGLSSVRAQARWEDDGGTVLNDG